ncbi:MAG: hypothetical protein R3E09_00200 [Novosphingobium sp.]
MVSSKQSSKWEMERIHAREEVDRVERERALKDILLLMDRHQLTLDHLRERGARDDTGHRKTGRGRPGSYDPVFGYR